MIGKALYAVLHGNTGVSTLVGTRIYPTLIPQKTPYPALVYRTDQVKEIPCRQPNGYFQGEFEIYALATDFPAAQSLINAVQLAIENFKGAAGGMTIRVGHGTQLDPAYDDKLNTYECAIQFNVTGKTS